MTLQLPARFLMDEKDPAEALNPSIQASASSQIRCRSPSKKLQFPWLGMAERATFVRVSSRIDMSTITLPE
jgi:hypothetical protein